MDPSSYLLDMVCTTYDLRHIFICSCSSRNIFFYDSLYILYIFVFLVSTVSIVTDPLHPNSDRVKDQRSFSFEVGSHLHKSNETPKKHV